MKKRKRMPVWMLFLTDLCCTLLCLGLFFLFDYILPQKSQETGTVVSSIESGEGTFSLPDTVDGEETSTDVESETQEQDKTDSQESTDSEEATDNEESTDSQSETDTEDSSSKGGPGHHSKSGGDKSKDSESSGKTNTSNTNTTEIESTEGSLSLSDRTITTLEEYQSDTLQLNITKNEVGSGDDKVTYYVADIYISDITQLQTAFATGSYGKNLRDTVENMAEENEALFAINGDYYGNSEDGVVIRNGVLYRDDLNDCDICVLFTDGSMQTYTADEFDADQVITDGAWQAWTFGPSLLDGSGNVLSSFNTTSYINSENPRCSIGYVEPGHYVMVVVDGRDEGYSRGVTLSELAQIMAEEGCQTAYNLDGGKSAAMVYNGEYVNEPADGGRTVSDIIYISE